MEAPSTLKWRNPHNWGNLWKRTASDKVKIFLKWDFYLMESEFMKIRLLVICRWKMKMKSASFNPHVNSILGQDVDDDFFPFFLLLLLSMLLSWQGYIYATHIFFFFFFFYCTHFSRVSLIRLVVVVVVGILTFRSLSTPSAWCSLVSFTRSSSSLLFRFRRCAGIRLKRCSYCPALVSDCICLFIDPRTPWAALGPIHCSFLFELSWLPLEWNVVVYRWFEKGGFKEQGMGEY